MLDQRGGSLGKAVIVRSLLATAHTAAAVVAVVLVGGEPGVLPCAFVSRTLSVLMPSL